MSDQRREITLSLGTMIMAVGIFTNQWCMSRQVERQLHRLADTADMEMCLDAIRVGIEPSTLPAPCKALRKESSR